MLRASIDVGSNSALLLIGDVGGENIRVLESHENVTALGRNLNQTKKFHPQSMEDSLAILKKYRDIIVDKYGLDPSCAIVTATEASRVATNSAYFFARVAKQLGLEVQIITPEGEAHYVARAIAQWVSPDAVAMDIGGASTELIRIVKGSVQTTVSLPVGALRPGLAQPPANFKTATLICTAGTMTSIAAMMGKLTKFDEEKIDGMEIKFEALKNFAEEIGKIDGEALLEKFPFLGKRCKSIGPGSRLAVRIGKALHVETFKVSTRGLCYGTLLAGKIEEHFFL